MERKKQIQIVLIEDNAHMMKFWSQIAKDYGHNLIIFENYEVLFQSLYDLGKDDLFFCDWKNGGEYVGIDESKKLYELGFKNLYLQTADVDSAKKMKAPWPFGVLGKAYPKKEINNYLKRAFGF